MNPELSRLRVCAFLAVCFAASIASAGPPLALDWTLPMDGFAAEPVVVRIDDAVELADGRVFVHGLGSLLLTADGRLQTAQAGIQRISAVAPIPDGSYVRQSGSLPYIDSELEWVEPSGQVGWRLSCGPQLRCLRLAPGVDEQVIVLHSEAAENQRPFWLQSYHRHGATHWRSDPVDDHLRPSDMVRDRRHDRLHVVFHSLVESGSNLDRQFTVQTFDAGSGERLWSWQSPVWSRGALTTSRSLDDGGMALIVTHMEEEEWVTTLVRLEVTNEVSSATPIQLFRGSDTPRVILAGDGGGFLFHPIVDSGSDAPVDAFLPDGRVVKRFTRTVGLMVAMGRDGSLWMSRDDEAGLYVVKISRDGEQRQEVVIPNGSANATRLTVQGMVPKEDGSMLLITQRHGDEFGVVSRQIKTLVLEPDLSVRVQNWIDMGEHRRRDVEPMLSIQPDTSVVAAFRGTQRSLSARVVNRYGATRWQRQFAAEQVHPVSRTEIWAAPCGDDRLCLETSQSLHVLDSRTGVPLRSLPSAHHALLHADGRFSLLRTSLISCMTGCAHSYSLSVVEPDGSVLPHSISFRPFAVAPDGSVLSAFEVPSIQRFEQQVLAIDGSRADWSLPHVSITENPRYSERARPFLSNALLSSATRARVLLGRCESEGCFDLAVADIDAGTVVTRANLPFPAHRGSVWVQSGVLR